MAMYIDSKVRTGLNIFVHLNLTTDGHLISTKLVEEPKNQHVSKHCISHVCYDMLHIIYMTCIYIYIYMLSDAGVACVLY